MIKQNKFISHFNISADKQQKFSDIRNRIDNIDDQIIDLLAHRTNIIREAKELKTGFYPEDKCFITPGREASMMKNILKKAQHTGLPAGAIFGIWRNIISSSTSLENPLVINIDKNNKQQDYFTDITEYFGKYTNINCYDSLEEILYQTANTNNSIAVLDYNSNWWQLLYQKYHQLKIFGVLPFVCKEKDDVRSVLISNILPEPTGDDITLFVCEDSNMQESDAIQHIATYENYHLFQKNEFFIGIPECFSGERQRNMVNIGSYATAVKLTYSQK